MNERFESMNEPKRLIANGHNITDHKQQSIQSGHHITDHKQQSIQSGSKASIRINGQKLSTASIGNERVIGNRNANGWRNDDNTEGQRRTTPDTEKAKAKLKAKRLETKALKEQMKTMPAEVKGRYYRPPWQPVNLMTVVSGKRKKQITVELTDTWKTTKKNGVRKF